MQTVRKKGGGIGGLRQINTCRQVPLPINFKEKPTFTVWCLDIYLVHAVNLFTDLAKGGSCLVRAPPAPGERRRLTPRRRRASCAQGRGSELCSTAGPRNAEGTKMYVLENEKSKKISKQIREIVIEIAEDITESFS